MPNDTTAGPEPYTRDKDTDTMNDTTTTPPPIPAWARWMPDGIETALIVLASHTRHLSEGPANEEPAGLASVTTLDRQIEDIAVALANLHSDPVALARAVEARALRTGRGAPSGDLAVRARYAAESVNWREGELKDAQSSAREAAADLAAAKAEADDITPDGVGPAPERDEEGQTEGTEAANGVRIHTLAVEASRAAATHAADLLRR